MSHARHHESEPATLSQVAGFQDVPPTQLAVAPGGNENWEVFNPQESAPSALHGDTLTWQIPASKGMTDIAQSYILFKGIIEITGKKDTDRYAPVPFFSAAQLNDVSVTVNGTTVVPSQGLAQPYCMAASIIKNESFADRQASEVTQLSILDDMDMSPAQYQACGTNPDLVQTLDFGGAIGNKNLRTLQNGSATEGAFKRRQVAFYGTDHGFSQVYRLADAGFRTGDWLPPDTSFVVRGRRSPIKFMLQGEDAATMGSGGNNSSAKFTLTSAKMYVSRKVLTESAHSAMRLAWEAKPCRIHYEHINSFTQFIPANTASVSIVGALTGTTPRTVYAVCVAQSSLSGSGGDGKLPTFSMRPTADHAVWNNVTLSVGGNRTYPIQPLNTLDSSQVYGTADLGELYQMYRSTCNSSPYLTSSDFMNYQPLCFQIATPSDGMDPTDVATSIHFEGTLQGNGTTAMPAWALILISFSDGICEIYNNGETRLV